MTARRVAYGIGFAVLVASGAYVLVYLYRWEWNRAQFAAMLFLIVETALFGARLLERAAHPPATPRPRELVDPAVLARVREAAAPGRRPFAWLAPRDGQLPVFVPVLMGAGVILSAVAWVVERVAQRSAAPILEQGLASQLGALALPSSLLARDDGPGALLLGPDVRT